MIRTADRSDLPKLRALFATANDAPYSLEAVTEEKCFGGGIGGEPVTRIYADGKGAAVTCGKWLRLLIVDRDARGRGIGSALLADAESRGASVIAAEPGNYFTPGVLEELVPFFLARGYVEKAATWNLEVELREWNSEGVTRPQDRNKALDFIEREFGRIWRFETSRALENLFITEEGGEVTGFVVHDANNRGLGFFGPTGVAKSHRGRGLGTRLTLAALADMHRAGYSRAVIPWTDALEFYRKSCGAEPAHRFIALTKQQPIDSAP